MTQTLPRILLLHVVDHPEQLGGVEKVVVSLAEGLTGRGVPCAAAVNEGRFQDELRKTGIDIYSTGRLQKKNVFNSVARIYSECNKFQPDIVHSHHRYTTFAVQIHPWRRFKLLHTFHVELFNKKYMRFFGDYATAVSGAVKDHFTRHFRARPDKIAVVYNGVKEPAGESVEGTCYIPKKTGAQINAVVLGRLEPQKGHEYLIEALGHIPSEKRECLKIVFLGKGSKREVLEQMIKARHLQNIELAGFQPDIFGWLSEADFTILPSLWEGFPLSILESYQCAKPVIATQVAGIPEVVTHRETGLLIPPKDPVRLAEAIVTLMDHPELVKKYGEAGRELARTKFSFEKMISSYLEVYREMMRYGS